MSAFKKSCLAVLLGLVSRERIYAQKHTYDALSTILEARKSITDSLLSHDVDTVISYYFGYASCPSASSPVAFIYWCKNGASKVTILKEFWRQCKKKEPQTEMAIYYADCGSIPFSVNYFEVNYDKIIRDYLQVQQRTKGTLYIHNYPFEDMETKVGDRQIKYSVINEQRTLNPDSYKITFIDNFRSFILSYFYTTGYLRFEK